MAWFAELAGKAENLLNNIDEQTGVALRNHNVTKFTKKYDRHDVIAFPEPSWRQKQRPIPRALKKIPYSDIMKPIYIPDRGSSPLPRQTSPPDRGSSPLPRQNSPIRVSHDHRYPASHPNSLTGDPKDQKNNPKLKKSTKKLYNLNHCPKTLVGDVEQTEIILDDKRHSFPDDYVTDELTFKMENIEVENAMLKNELNVVNREVADMIDSMRGTEDGETVVNDSSKELSKTKTKLQHTENLNHEANAVRDTLISQLEQLKSQVITKTTEIDKLKDQKNFLDKETAKFKEQNVQLEAIIRKLSDTANERDSAKVKLEKDLRQAQTTIKTIQNDLERSNNECKRLEKDWDTYKCRVKGMLTAKDKEVKALKDGLNLTEDTKILVEQIDNLREERDVLSEAVGRVHSECNEMKHYMETMQTRLTAAERVVLALRGALKDERSSRNRAETQCGALSKELKSIQIESGQTIASLRTALRDKENELRQLKYSTSSFVPPSDASALNVADYDINEESIDNEKLLYLTQKLVQGQGKIDKLLGENNTLKIQLEKWESKYNASLEFLADHKAHAHSVVHFQENDPKTRSLNQPVSSLTKLSLRIDKFIRRNPLFRIMIIMYMVGLHFWVLTVLFTSTP